MPVKILQSTSEVYVYDPDNTKLCLQKKGKFSSTYIGKSQAGGQTVLIKKLNPELSDNQAARQSFHKEFLLHIAHPGFPKTLDYIETIDSVYLVREYINGFDLKHFIQGKMRSKTDTAFRVSVLKKLLEALSFLHAQNILHCDVKPANILLPLSGDKRGAKALPEPLILDFGLARTVDTGNLPGGKIPFSFLYASPEQLLGRHHLVREASDLYSLAVCIYEWFSGQNPFRAAHPMKIIALQISYPLPPDKNIPKETFQQLQKATARFPFPKSPVHYTPAEVDKMLLEGIEKRYKSAKEWLNDIKY